MSGILVKSLPTKNMKYFFLKLFVAGKVLFELISLNTLKNVDFGIPDRGAKYINGSCAGHPPPSKRCFVANLSGTPSQTHFFDHIFFLYVYSFHFHISIVACPKSQFPHIIFFIILCSTGVLFITKLKFITLAINLELLFF